jgi:tetratricopeptide (TPR) repeat protein
MISEEHEKFKEYKKLFDYYLENLDKLKPPMKSAERVKWLQEAYKYLTQGEYDKAIEIYKDLLEKCSEDKDFVEQLQGLIKHAEESKKRSMQKLPHEIPTPKMPLVEEKEVE